MPLSGRFSKAQLHAIIDEATIYMCACPAQVCQQMLELIALFEYQEQCLERAGNAEVHDRIAAATTQAYGALEDCLEQILDIEGWDRSTLKMPLALRQLRAQALE
jgi:hypothetical protein